MALITANGHLKRAKTIFKNYGIIARAISSEKLLKKRSPHYEYFVKKYSRSARVKLDKIKESILRWLLIIDPEGKLLRIITKRLRSKQ